LLCDALEQLRDETPIPAIATDEPVRSDQPQVAGLRHRLGGRLRNGVGHVFDLGLRVPFERRQEVVDLFGIESGQRRVEAGLGKLL
jgi:hypothetical protein